MPRERETQMMTTECPFCLKDAHMTLRWGYLNYSEDTTNVATTCDNCGMIVVGLNRAIKQGYTDQLYTESIDAVRLAVNKADETPWTWFPGHADEGSIEHLPGHIDKAVKEAYRTCSQRNYISSILMARTAIEAAAKDNGVVDGKLFHKINEMQKQNLIREDVAAVAHSIRVFGNDMAHGDINVEVTVQDATEVLVLLAEIMNEIYGRAARLASITGRIKEREARAKAMKDEKE